MPLHGSGPPLPPAADFYDPAESVRAIAGQRFGYGLHTGYGVPGPAPGLLHEDCGALVLDMSGAVTGQEIVSAMHRHMVTAHGHGTGRRE
jgi:hypothetical protein